MTLTTPCTCRAWQQGVSEALQERQQPINEINALVNGQQMQNPQWTQTPQVAIQAPDIAGMTYKNFQDKQANYQAGMGGLFGLGGAALGAGGYAFGRSSDRRVKKISSTSPTCPTACRFIAIPICGATNPSTA